MKQKIRLLKACIFLIILLPMQGCEKYLDAKPDAKIAAPTSIEDVQLLLDNYTVMNISSPNLAMQSDDDFYLTDTYLNSLPAEFQQAYKWEQDVEGLVDWRAGYKMVLHSNMALETLQKITADDFNRAAIKSLTGSALFYRSLAFFHLAQHFAIPYDAAGAAALPGIPLRVSSDINTPNIRHSMQATYDSIIAGLQHALPMLPATAVRVSRPSKAAAYALLSNLYLNMRAYDKAGEYADSALRLHEMLINYNSVSASAAVPFAQFNSEVIFGSAITGHRRFNLANGKVDSSLYDSYASNDLRKTLYYRASGSPGQYGFKGNYEGNTYGALFNGFTSAEMLLIKAEAAARAGQPTEAMEWLNRLLITRWKTGSFVPFTAADEGEALDIVLRERRKELVGRGKRWYDLRRLNTEAGRATVLKRKTGGNEILLPPTSKRYTFLIPYQVVNETGMQQNER
ncbi:MAG: RagB/SusD family nutrient uptake outer membrane protein [Sphingobacteriales bacterium]|nr:MAG: RagB/SusD family nutrient uptake outer membrane protein [Sphingobacteriales bacterium]